jgi:two-component system sensor histidine kinase and response regulator WspE
MNDDDLSQLSMLELFRMEAESQSLVLTTGLLALERDPAAVDQLDACMRAAHSLKGAARIVGLKAGVDIAHAMEDCFVAMKRGNVVLRQKQIDLLLAGVDLLTRIANMPESNVDQPHGEKLPEVSTYLAQLTAMLNSPEEDAPASEPAPAAAAAEREAANAVDAREGSERVLRVTAHNLDRVLGLSGESLVESRWLKPFAESLLRLKRLHFDTAKALNNLREALPEEALNEQAESALAETQERSPSPANVVGTSRRADAFNSRPLTAAAL